MKVFVIGGLAALSLMGCSGIATAPSDLGKPPGQAPQPRAGSVPDATSEITIVARSGGYTSTTTWGRDVTYDKSGRPIDGNWQLGSYSEVRDNGSGNCNSETSAKPCNEGQ